MPGIDRFDFTGQVALITGGGTGIGRGIAEAFIRAGGVAVITGRREEKLAPLREAYPERGDYVRMDVMVDADRRHAVDIVIARHGRLDLLVNNAMNFSAGPFDRMEAGAIHDMYDVLLAAPTYLSQLALPHLKASGGSIINISSIAARYIAYPGGSTAVYAAAKAGISQLTRALATEVGGDGVRVNAIAPGMTWTEAAEQIEDGGAAIAALTPLGRVGQPDDIAQVALFLASDAAHWVSGEVITASGGWGLAG